MSERRSNAMTATAGGSPPISLSAEVMAAAATANEIRNGLQLRHALAEAIWNAMPDGEASGVPWALLGAAEREEPLASARAALAVIARRVLLPKLHRALTAPMNMPAALSIEEIFVALTGQPPLQFVNGESPLERDERAEFEKAWGGMGIDQEDAQAKADAWAGWEARGALE
jgi:hypothetical protein